MFWASSWQWSRYKWKVEIVNSYRANAESAALDFPTNATNEKAFKNVLNRKVKISGRYDFDKQMIVKNRKHATGPGFWLLTPFKIKNSNRYIVVSRGFIPFKDKDKETWSKYNRELEEDLYAVVQKSVKQMNFIAPKSHEKSEGFINEWFYPDINEMAKQLPYPMISEVFLQRLSKPNDPEFPAQAISIRVPPSTHFGYTIEWAILGILTLLVGFFLQTLGGDKKNDGNDGTPYLILTTMMSPRTIIISAILTLTSPALIPPFLSLTSSNSLNHHGTPYHSYAAESATEAKDATEIVENRGLKIDLELEFFNRDGKLVRLRELMNNRPVMIVPVYYKCPSLCNLTLNGVTNLINDLELSLKDDYQIITYSINPRETHDLAKKKAENYFKTLDQPENAKTTWHFLSTQNQETITKLSKQLGFGYKEDKNDYMHAALLVVASPQGAISQYFYNINFPPNDIRLALIEASEGKIGSALDRVLLYCFRFDPNRGKYTLAILRITRIISLIGLALLIGVILVLKLRERKKL